MSDQLLWKSVFVWMIMAEIQSQKPLKTSTHRRIETVYSYDRTQSKDELLLSEQQVTFKSPVEFKERR